MSGPVAILIVEDDRAKLSRILTVLNSVDGVRNEDISIARTASAAKEELRIRRFDLMILDLLLPVANGKVDPDGGVSLLEDLHEEDDLQTPDFIVGLTAFDELKDRAVSRFENYTSLILKYEVGSPIWEEKLRKRVVQLSISPAPQQRQMASAFVCVVAALHEPELRAVRDLPWDWRAFQSADGTSEYYEGFAPTHNGKQRVIAAAPRRMGMVSASVLTTRLIYEFRPHYVAMVGLTAGFRDEAELGDVICAELAWEWSSGKHVIERGAPLFKQAPYQYALDQIVQTKVRRIAENKSLLAEIKYGWRGIKPSSDISVKIGPLASGSAVLSDPELMKSLKAQHRKVLGVDMEAYGVFAACEETITPEPRALVIKAVSDFGDSEKNDDFQAYCAYVSAAVLGETIKLLP